MSIKNLKYSLESVKAVWWVRYQQSVVDRNAW